MNSLDLFLVQYGLTAIFMLLLIKTIGVPIPIPADLIILTAAARVAQGKLIMVAGIHRHLDSTRTGRFDPICAGARSRSKIALPFRSLYWLDLSSS